MTELHSRREILKSLTTMGLLCVIDGSLQIGTAQPAFQKVSEVNVENLFYGVLSDKFNAWRNRHDFDSEDNLSQKFARADEANSSNALSGDPRRALILAFGAMGGVRHVMQVAEVDFPVWGATENIERDIDAIPPRYTPQYTEQAMRKVIAHEVSLPGTFDKSVTFAQEVVRSANAFLDDMIRDKLDFRSYIIERRLPDDPTDTRVDLAIKAEAIRFGLRARTNGK